MIVIVLGLPGSGKSYFAERLAKQLDAEYLNSDRLRRELLSKRTYSDQEKAKVYAVMLEKMEEALQQKKSLVLDATFHKNESREPFLEKGKGKIFVIEVQADEAIIKERIQKNRPFSEADFEVYEFIKQEWKPLEVPHLVLESTNENIEAMLQQALEYFKNDQESNR